MFTDKYTLDIPEDLQYTTSLLGGLILAFFVPHLKQGSTRSVYSSIVGFSILTFLSGIEIFHWIVVTIASFILVALLHKTKYCGPAVFIVSFGYQGMVRYLSLANIYTLGNAANTAMLMQALKVIAFAYDVQTRGQMESLSNYIHYLLFFPGIWSAPYLNYKDVIECLNRDYSKVAKPDSLGFVLYRVACGSFYMIFFLFIRASFPPNYILTGDFSLLPLIAKIIILHLTIISFRSRHCFGWTIADATCGAAGVCYDPSFTYKIDTVKLWQVNCLELETSTSLQAEIRNWNRSVQSWMALYPYKYAPFKGKFARQLATMAVSAYWHGLNPGYYMAFVLFPFFQASQEAAFGQPLPGENSNQMMAFVWGLVRRLVTGMLMSFSIVPFVFLTFEDSWKAWSQLRYFGFFLVAIFFAIGFATKKRRSKHHKALKEEKADIAKKAAPEEIKKTQ